MPNAMQVRGAGRVGNWIAAAGESARNQVTFLAAAGRHGAASWQGRLGSAGSAARRSGLLQLIGLIGLISTSALRSMCSCSSPARCNWRCKPFRHVPLLHRCGGFAAVEGVGHRLCLLNQSRSAPGVDFASMAYRYPARDCWDRRSAMPKHQAPRGWAKAAVTELPAPARWAPRCKLVMSAGAGPDTEERHLAGWRAAQQTAGGRRPLQFLSLQPVPA
jgi:hypothetical protein